MRHHLHDKSAKAKPVEKYDGLRLRVWCGRAVWPANVTTSLTSTGCQQCREAFARELAKLPNAFEDSNR